MPDKKHSPKTRPGKKHHLLPDEISHHKWKESGRGWSVFFLSSRRPLNCNALQKTEENWSPKLQAQRLCYLSYFLMLLKQLKYTIAVNEWMLTCEWYKTDYLMSSYALMLHLRHFGNVPWHTYTSYLPYIAWLYIFSITANCDVHFVVQHI